MYNKLTNIKWDKRALKHVCTHKMKKRGTKEKKNKEITSHHFICPGDITTDH